MTQEAQFSPLPGKEYIDQSIVKKVFKKFVTAEGRKSGNGYAWMWLVKGIKIDVTVLDQYSSEQLFIYHEATHKLHVASGEEIKNYFQNLPAWEDYGIVVFKEDLSWCMAYGEDTFIASSI